MSVLVAETKDLAQVLRVMERVLPRRTDLAAQGVFCLWSVDGMGHVWGGSSQERLCMSFPAKGEWEGALPAVELCRAVRSSPGSQIEISDHTEESFKISSGGAGWVVGRFIDTVFSRWESTDGDHLPDGFRFLLEHENGLSDARYAVGTEDARPALAQVYVGAGGVAASDGQKAHRFLLDDPSESGSVLFPQRSVALLLDLSGACDSEMTIHDADECLVVRSDRFEYLVGKGAFEFPDLDRFIWSRVKSQTGRFTVDRKSLATALSVADVTLDQDRVALSWRGGRMSVVGAGHRGVGQMWLPIQADQKVDGHEVHVSASDLADLVDALKPDNGKLMFTVQGTDQADRDDPGLLEASAINGNGVSQAALRAQIIL